VNASARPGRIGRRVFRLFKAVFFFAGAFFFFFTASRWPLAGFAAAAFLAAAFGAVLLRREDFFEGPMAARVANSLQASSRVRARRPTLGKRGVGSPVVQSTRP